MEGEMLNDQLSTLNIQHSTSKTIQKCFALARYVFVIEDRFRQDNIKSGGSTRPDLAYSKLCG
jgi:hypothetical protein